MIFIPSIYNRRHNTMTKDVTLRNIAPFALAALLSTLGACDPQPVQPTVNDPPAPAQTAVPAAQDSNDFPTLTRVEYVMQCMQEHGGQNYDNMYHCVCAIDAIASMMSREDYDQAQTFTNLFGLAGERGGEFRDPPESERLRKKLKESKAAANESCFPKKHGEARK
jgi:hypothetical protein